MNRFVLIDGNAILHRAYHALPPLTSSSGEIVNAVYGFFSMFLKILEDLKPSFIAVCFDRAKPTFRQEMYVGYHATRPKLDDNFIGQIILVHDALEKMGIAIFELDGYEADDMIGTLAFQATFNTEKRGIKTRNHAEKGIEVIIVSGDRDLLQLVNHNVKVLAPLVGLTNTTLYDEEKVEERFGITPKQFVDYKALVGDASDNYPGVSGIGPKTAADLLRKYGSFEKLYENLGELPPKISVKLATDAEQASLAKKLAKIVCDAPIHLDIEKCSMKYFDTTAAKGFFGELGFKSLMKRLNNGSNLNERTATTASNAASAETLKKSETLKSGEQLGLI